MAFGNPYGDEWSPHIVAHWAEKLLNDFGVNILHIGWVLALHETVTPLHYRPTCEQKNDVND